MGCKRLTLKKHKFYFANKIHISSGKANPHLRFVTFGDSSGEGVKQLDTQLQENISHRIEETLNHTSQVVSNAIERSTTKHVKTIVNTLEQAVERAAGSLRTYRELFYSSLRHWVLAAVLGSFITASLLAFVFIPRLSPSLTNEQLSDLSYGQYMGTIWSKLPKKKRKELRTLYNNTLLGKKQTPIQAN